MLLPLSYWHSIERKMAICLQKTDSELHLLRLKNVFGLKKKKYTKGIKIKWVIQLEKFFFSLEIELQIFSWKILSTTLFFLIFFPKGNISTPYGRWHDFMRSVRSWFSPYSGITMRK